MILQGTLTLTVCLFVFFMQRRKKDSFRSFLNSLTCIVHPLLKLFSLVERKHIFQKFTDVCYHRGFEFQTKLVI